MLKAGRPSGKPSQGFWQEVANALDQDCGSDTGEEVITLGTCQQVETTGLGAREGQGEGKVYSDPAVTAWLHG